MLQDVPRGREAQKPSLFWMSTNKGITSSPHSHRLATASRARAVLTEHKETLDRITKALLERESLQSDELDTLICRPAAAP